MKYHASAHQFQYPWEQVASSFWRRYPNPNSKHVLSEDVIDRHIREDGCLYTKRLLTKTNDLPKWGQRFVGNLRKAYIIEESIVDPKKKTIVTYTKNIGTLTKVMNVEEKCEYQPSPDSPTQATDCVKQAWISSPIPLGAGWALTAFGFQRMVRNVNKASDGFKFVLANHHGDRETETVAAAKSCVKDKLKSGAEKARETAKESAGKAKEKAKQKAASVLNMN